MERRLASLERKVDYFNGGRIIHCDYWCFVESVQSFVIPDATAVVKWNLRHNLALAQSKREWLLFCHFKFGYSKSMRDTSLRDLFQSPASISYTDISCGKSYLSMAKIKVFLEASRCQSTPFWRSTMGFEQIISHLQLPSCLFTFW